MQRRDCHCIDHYNSEKCWGNKWYYSLGIVTFISEKELSTKIMQVSFVRYSFRGHKRGVFNHFTYILYLNPKREFQVNAREFTTMNTI